MVVCFVFRFRIFDVKDLDVRQTTDVLTKMLPPAPSEWIPNAAHHYSFAFPYFLVFKDRSADIGPFSNDVCFRSKVL